MPEDNIIFEPIEKDVEKESHVFKQPISGKFPNLYEELKDRCNPRMFMSPYEPEKVDRANELYSIILSTDKKDEETLKSLRKKAMEELGVLFSTEKLYEMLEKVCNPQNYTDEFYNKQLISKANRLYQKILENADDVIALEEIEKEAQELIEEYDSRRKEEEEEDDDDDNVDKYIIFIIAVVVIFFILILFLWSLSTVNVKHYH